MPRTESFLGSHTCKRLASIARSRRPRARGQTLPVLSLTIAATSWDTEKGLAWHSLTSEQDGTSFMGVKFGLGVPGLVQRATVGSQIGTLIDIWGGPPAFLKSRPHFADGSGDKALLWAITAGMGYQAM